MQQLLIMGRATKNAEILESKEGKSYARFSVAVNEFVGSDREQKVTYYNCLVFNRNSINAIKIQKGDLVMVDGRPDVDAYLSNEGEAKANLIVVADRFKVLK
ncbi:MAG: single-stranded DNA-binding protein [Snowella sp.]|nr:single-stranded DNA-binding protein [Snowella sp.]